VKCVRDMFMQRLAYQHSLIRESWAVGDVEVNQFARAAPKISFCETNGPLFSGRSGKVSDDVLATRIVLLKESLYCTC
jgi:hypothetical protein